MTTNAHPGMLALVGGAEWRDQCSFDVGLLTASGGTEVLVLPTAAAYEHPHRAVATAARHFEALGGQVRGLMVLGRTDAEEAEMAAVVRGARFIYLGGGSPLHLRSVLKDSKVWQALEEAWHDGAVVAGSSAGAMALCDPMIDPRGGALTLGLGLIEQVAVLPHANTWSPEKAHRTFSLAAGGLRIAAIDEQTALIRERDGTWRTEGAGNVRIFVDGKPADLDALNG
ncbi:MAG: cyanophycinase [Acidimicrobiaceae bacterium]|jgi:cyanophycinase|nr:cyanophycinase [Acidimicrobiaceae bacterium]